MGASVVVGGRVGEDAVVGWTRVVVTRDGTVVGSAI